jgi:uncharacterized membrane protein (DUF4010 family)
VLGISFLVGSIVTLFVSRGIGAQGDLPDVKITNPTEMKAALSFGMLFATVLLLSAWLRDVAGDKGLYLVALAAGLADLDAINLSTLRLTEREEIAGITAITAIVLALASNQGAKLVYIFTVGGRKLFLRCLIPMIATALAAGIATLLFARG